MEINIFSRKIQFGIFFTTRRKGKNNARLKNSSAKNFLLRNTDSCNNPSNNIQLEKNGTNKNNQTELYQGNKAEKKLLKAKSLEAVWPQYVETRVRFGRIHHYVNWKKHFKQPLIRIDEKKETK